MKKQYWLILIVYTLMQLLGSFGIKAITKIGQMFGLSFEEAQLLSIPIWLVGSFTIVLLIVLLLLKEDMKDYFADPVERAKTSYSTIIFWSIAGVFLALFSQSIAAQIELKLFGVQPGSENTQAFLTIIQAFPIVIIVTSIIGPILEELVFRKVIFGAIYKRSNFFIAALASSLIFAVAHNDLEHTLLYAAMGFVFAFLYVKTKRIIVPIIAHVSMNTFVIVVQLLFADDIERQLQQFEQLQFIFGGL